MELQVNVTVGDQVEGLKVDADLVGLLWPGVSQSALAANSRDFLKLAILGAYVVHTASGLVPAQSFIDQHTTMTH